MTRSPPIELPQPRGRPETNLSSTGIKFQVAREVLSCALYLVFVFIPVTPHGVHNQLH
jgi:hypothetical protein